MAREVSLRRNNRRLQQRLLGVSERTERKEPRFKFVIPILVSGFNVYDRLFQETTMTCNLSQHGCRFHLDQMPACSSHLAVFALPRGVHLNGNPPHVLCKVVSIRQAGRGWDVSAFVEGDIGILELAFSSPLLLADGQTASNRMAKS